MCPPPVSSQQSQSHPGADQEITQTRSDWDKASRTRKYWVAAWAGLSGIVFFLGKTKLDGYLGWQYIFPISDLCYGSGGMVMLVVGGSWWKTSLGVLLEYKRCHEQK